MAKIQQSAHPRECFTLYKEFATFMKDINLKLQFDRKIEGTSVITFELLPQHNMQAVVDCVGILKERLVKVSKVTKSWF